MQKPTEEPPELRLQKNKRCEKIVFPQDSQVCKETSPLAQVVEQWTGNPKAAGWIPAERQLFRIACLSSRRSDGSSLVFRAGSL